MAEQPSTKSSNPQSDAASSADDGGWLNDLSDAFSSAVSDFPTEAEAKTAPTAVPISAAPVAAPVAAPPAVRPPATPPASGELDAAAKAQKDAFRVESQRLQGRADWAALATLIGGALDGQRWTAAPEARASLLTDLARIYRDRLRDPAAAEREFRRLCDLLPGNPEGLDFLGRRYRERGDWKALFDLQSAAVEATWDPRQRLEWTREAANIASELLHAPELVIEAWERLFRLGDAADESARALSEAYRVARKWDRLADFLSRRAETLEQSSQVVVLRELAEVYLSGLRQPERAGAVLERILLTRPSDPIARLAMARVLARRKDWEAFAQLGIQPLDGFDDSIQLDVRRLVAEALRQAGELKRAAVVYDLILQSSPREAEAWKGLEEYLVAHGKLEALVALLGKLSDLADSDEARAALLSRAAVIAARDLNNGRLAVSLQERRAKIPAASADALTALVALYDDAADHQGLRSALERQLALTANPQVRIELLRRLGQHAAHNLNDSAQAERCWLQILSAVPDDREVRAELTALYRQRQDFEAVDRALTSQAWRPSDDTSLLAVWRAAAVNLQENIADPERTIAAWRRVLDLAPDDAIALRALIPHYRALGRRRELIAALEAELHTAIPNEQRIESGLEIVALWEAEGDRPAAIAAVERVLRWQPTAPPALAALAKLRASEPGVLRGAVDIALANQGSAAPLSLRRRPLELVDESDSTGRFFALRRLLQSSGPDANLISQLTEAADDAAAYGELAAVYSDLAAQATDPTQRDAQLYALARLYEEKLNDPVRAFLTLSAARQAPVHDLTEIELLLKLAELTGRFEDALALLEIAAAATAPLPLRRAAIRRRQILCESRLASPERAFYEAVRLVRLDPHDRAALKEVHRLAAGAQLWRSLDALYAELWDRADSLSERLEIARARHDLAAGPLGDALAALDHLLLLYRLDPSLPGLEEQLLAETEKQAAWSRVLPLVEARVRAQGGTAAELRWIANLSEERSHDLSRAFELSAEALLLSPDSLEQDPRLEDRLATLATPQLRPLLATILRTAAARAKLPSRILGLFGRVAELYSSLGRTDLALDVHQRIIQLEPTAIASLRVAISHRQARGYHRELRDALQQLLAAGPEAPLADKVAIELEIARLSHDKLGDAETALTTYARILESDAHNPAALAGVQSLTDGNIPPALELRRLRIELSRAAGPRRVELQLASARLQKEELDDADGAIATLRTLVAESGPDGAGFDPLVQLLTAKGAWSELVDLLETRAATLPSQRARGECLDRAVAIDEQYGDAVSAPRRERLYRQLLALRPDDGALRWRLIRLLRDAERYGELATELALLADRTALADSDQDPRFFDSELVRVYDQRLDRTADAEARIAAQSSRAAQDPEPLLWLASIRLRKGDRPGYLKLRERQAKLLPPTFGALVYCHLAEAVDDQNGSPEQVLSYYRSARGLDQECRPAVEGMKALGRRIKSWRSAAALLPDADERDLGFAARSARLRQKGLAADVDARTAIGWLERAVAINPDDYAAWDGLAAALSRLGDAGRALATRRSALAAFERAVAPGPQSVSAHAARVEELAAATLQSGDTATADRLFERAHAIMPSLPKAALAVAQQRLAAGELDAAYALYDRVLAGGSELTEAERLLATYQRGTLAARQGRTEQAAADLREGLRIDPLHPGLLQALAEVMAASGRPVAAVQHYEQALLVAAQPRQRGLLYARLARLWDDRLKQPEEAGVCYDLAVRAGIEDLDLMMRALSYYRRSGQHDRAATIIDELLRRTTAPADLAALWTERASLALERDEGQAMEAFDMALSYDPTYQPALDGLLLLLERRGEWQQVMDILEARADSSAPADKARALRHLARIAQSQLGDTGRAESYLRTVIALSPERQDYRDLLKLLSDSPENQATRQELISGLVALGDPAMPPLLETGQRQAAAGQRRYAWALLSPLLNAVYSDQGLKALVLGLRKEFEKADLPALGGSDTFRRVLARPLSDALLDLLVEIDGGLAMGRRSSEGLGAARATRLDAKTGVGKMFAAMQERLGVEQAQLTRVDELGEPFRLLNEDVLHVAVRSEVLLTLSPGEFQSLFAMVLSLGQPGVRLFTVGTAEERQRWAEVLIDAGGGPAATSELAQGLAAEARTLVGAQGCQLLGELLAGLPTTAIELAAQLHDAAAATAWRVALLVSGELRQAARLQTRLDETLPKMPSAGKLEEFSDFFAGAAPLRQLVAFAVSPACAALFGS